MIEFWQANTPSDRTPVETAKAVEAAAAVTLQAISGGRAVLGIGRGDSALAYLGYGPVKLSASQRALRDLRTLPTGGEIVFDATAKNDAPSSDTLPLGERPAATRLRWLPAGMPKVPLDVAATGPKVIGLAAQLAEQVTFSVGAMPELVGPERRPRRAGARGIGSSGRLLRCSSDRALPSLAGGGGRGGAESRRSARPPPGYDGPCRRPEDRRRRGEF